MTFLSQNPVKNKPVLYSATRHAMNDIEPVYLDTYVYRAYSFYDDVASNDGNLQRGQSEQW